MQQYSNKTFAALVRQRVTLICIKAASEEHLESTAFMFWIAGDMCIIPNTREPRIIAPSHPDGFDSHLLYQMEKKVLPPMLVSDSQRIP